MKAQVPLAAIRPEQRADFVDPVNAGASGRGCGEMS